MLLSSQLTWANDSYLFIENGGRFPENVKYVLNLSGATVFFEHDRVLFSLYQAEEYNYDVHKSIPVGTPINHHVYSMNFLDSEPSISISAIGDSGTKFNYIKGQNTKSNLRGFEQVLYENVWPGVSLRFYISGENIKYDVIIKSSAASDKIKFEYIGLQNIRIKEGMLNLKTSLGDIEEEIPYAYSLNNKNTTVDCEYNVIGNVVSYKLFIDSDVDQDIVIDPILIFSTFSGSTSDNWGNTATYDLQGNLYSGGITEKLEGTFYPTTLGAFQTFHSGEWDVAITKYDSIGSSQIYSTYLGGERAEIPQSLVVNSRNELVIMGVTSSINFPTTEGAFERFFQGGVLDNIVGVPMENGTDIFVTVLAEDGGSLVGSTYIGGGANDGYMPDTLGLTKNYGDESRGDVYVDEQDNIYIASKTSSKDFPMVNSVQSNYNGGILDAIVVKMNRNLTNIIWSTYLGGSNIDAAYSLKKNEFNQVIVSGGTMSDDFNSLMINSYSGDVDGWVLLINDFDNPSLANGRYLGTDKYDQSYFIDLDIDNNIYLYGQTSGEYPIQGDVYSSGNGQFIHKFSADLSESLFSTNFGSSNPGPDISPTAFLVNDCGNIYLSGWGGDVNSDYIGGSTNNMPVTLDAYQPVTSGSDFYLAVMSDNAEDLIYGTFLGGTISKTHVDGGTSRFDKSGIVYHAVCAGCGAGAFSGASDFPTTPGAFSETNDSFNCNNASFKFDLSSLKAEIRPNNLTLTKPNTKNFCLGDDIVFENLSVGGETFLWDLGDGRKLDLKENENIVHQYLNEGTYIVKLVIIDKSTCSEVDSTSTEVTVVRPNIVLPADGTICEGESVTLAAGGGSSYLWSDENFIEISRASSITFTPDETLTLNIEVKTGGCIKEGTVTITVIEKPEFDSVLFREDCSEEPKFNFSAVAFEGDWYWDFGNGETSSTAELEYTYPEEGIFDVSFNVKKEQCLFSDKYTIEALNIVIPSVFTPGLKDGKNDTFKIFGGSSVNLSVYNRWGTAVFQSVRYDNSWAAESVETGTYYYDVVINNSVYCKGWVQILNK